MLGERKERTWACFGVFEEILPEVVIVLLLRKVYCLVGSISAGLR